MSRKRFDTMSCPIAQSLNQIGDWWSLLIVRDAMFGRRRFSEFEASLGISKNILRDRLAQLVEVGVFHKVDVGEYGQHYEYVLTDKGKDLFVLVMAVKQWGEKWVLDNDANTIEIYDRQFKQPIQPLKVTDIRGDILSLKDVYINNGLPAEAKLKN